MEEKNKMQEVFAFIKERNLLGELAERANATRSTVSAAFANERIENLKGKQLAVFSEAVKMIEEINLLHKRAEEALSK